MASSMPRLPPSTSPALPGLTWMKLRAETNQIVHETRLIPSHRQRRFPDNYPSAIGGRRSRSRISSPPPPLLTRFFSLLQNLLDRGRYYVPYGYARRKNYL